MVERRPERDLRVQTPDLDSGARAHFATFIWVYKLVKEPLQNSETIRKNSGIHATGTTMAAESGGRSVFASILSNVDDGGGAHPLTLTATNASYGLDLEKIGLPGDFY